MESLVQAVYMYGGGAMKCIICRHSAVYSCASTLVIQYWVVCSTAIHLLSVQYVQLTDLIYSCKYLCVGITPI